MKKQTAKSGGRPASKPRHGIGRAVAILDNNAAMQVGQERFEDITRAPRSS
jgi:hypothetical protein